MTVGHEEHVAPLASAAHGRSGSRTMDRTGSACPPGVSSSTHAWPNQVNVGAATPIVIEASCRVSAPASVAVPAIIGASAPGRGHGYTPRSARRADRHEPRAHQLDPSSPASPSASFAVVLLGTPSPTSATKGYLAFTAACAAAFGVLAYLSDTGLPPLGLSSPIPVNAAFDEPHGGRPSSLFVVLAGGPRPSRLDARAGGPSSRRSPGSSRDLRSSSSTALTWGGGPPGRGAARDPARDPYRRDGRRVRRVILGHWYLVTPKLPEARLVLVPEGSCGSALQARPVRRLVGFGAGSGATGGPFSALIGQWALFVWLRL